MNTLNFEGIGSMQGGEYSHVSISGIGSCKGDIKAEEFSVEGIFNSKGSVETELFSCDGVAEIGANIRAKKMVINGVVKVKYGTKIEADEIDCDGTMHIDGEISADKIMANGFINATEIVGDQVTIHSQFGMFSKAIMKKFSRVELIEATTVDIACVVAKHVSGMDVTIGPNCKIESVDCSGTLFIDPSASVGNVTGNYTCK